MGTIKKILLGSACASLLAGHAARAQDTAAPSVTQVAGLETVIVTARKRAENAQAVPIAITALDQTSLDKLSVQTVEDLKYIAPSVYVAPTTFRQDTLNVTIRGQRDFDSSSGQSVMSFDTAAAIYMDGVYMARPVGLTAALFDVDSLEVLKGPQGTLVGRNSTGGAVLYQTRQPTDTYGGNLTVSGGDHGRGTVEGAINIPLTDNLFFRAAAQIADEKGYIVNHYFDPATGIRNTQPAMGSDKIAGNFSLRWLPDSSWDILLRADISAEHDTGSSYHDLGFFPGTGNRNGKPAICNIPGSCNAFTDFQGRVVAPYYTTVGATAATGINPAPAAYNSLLQSVAREQTYGFWSTEQAVSDLDVGHYQTVSATVNKTLGDDISVKWLSAYRWWDNTGVSASRGLPYDTTEYDYNDPDYKSFQSELTVNGDALGDKLKWTTGLFFFQEDSPDDGGLFYLFLPGNGTPAPGKGVTLQDGSKNSQMNTSYAAYAQATYAITPDTRLTVGGRYTYDQRHAFLALQDIIFPATPASTLTTHNGVFDPGTITLHGINYTGSTRVCALTDASSALLPASQCAANINAGFHKPTYTIAIDHDLWDGTLAYVTTRSGYRSGAINSAAVQPSAIIAKPENVTDYEAGIKSDFDVLGIPIRANVDGYFSDYHDIQALVNLPNVTLATGPAGVPCTQALFNAGSCPAATFDNVTLNAKTAHIFGAEWDITAVPLPGLTLNTSGSYLDARYTNFSYTPPLGYLFPVGGGTNLSGTPFPLPVWQTNETASYATGLKDLGGLPIGDLSFTAHYYWQGRYLANLTGFDPSQRTGSYGFLNLRIDLLNPAGKNVDLALTMNNALNTPACLPEYSGQLSSAPQGSFGTLNASGVTQCVPLAPRMTGMQLSYKF